MKKRLLSLLLVCIMVLGMLPSTVLADELTPTTEVSTGDGPAQITKRVEKNDDGTYKLTMEAYVTGKVQTTAGKPLDIVLVLDQSGSMADRLDGNTTRQAAMKDAVTSFISTVAANSSEHRISIVTFGSGASTLIGWTQVNETGTTALTNAVGKLPPSPSGATRVDKGMEEASGLVASAMSDELDHDCVVIVFTDGVPTTHTDFDTDVATSAIRTAKSLKGSFVDIYTVGIFTGANPVQLYGDEYKYSWPVEPHICNGEIGDYWGISTISEIVNWWNEFPDYDIPAGNRFLNYLSNNFPSADEIGITECSKGLIGGHGWEITANFVRESSSYYKTASSASELNSIFNAIAESIVPDVTADAGVELSDTLTGEFSFVYDGENVRGLSFAVSNAIGSDKEPDWGIPVTVSDVSASVDGKSITFSGFDYSANAVVQKGGTWQGAKLVVTFDIQVDTTGLQQGTHLYDTNNTGNSKAALTPSGGTPIAELDDSPSILLTAYALTYRFEGDIPGGYSAPKDNNNCYLAGTEATLASTDDYYSVDGYTFEGWYLNDIKVEGTTITMDSDKELVGKWSRDLLTLTYDSTSGSWDSAPTGHTAAEGTPITEVSIALKPQNGYTLLSSELPTHANKNDTKVLFVGWTKDADRAEKIYSKKETDILNDLITTVDLVDENITVYAVWGYDTDESGIPDVKEAWYNLYYDANGGEGAPANETDLPVGPHTLSAQKPTHDAVDNYDVLFMGWSLTKVDSILSKDDKDKVPELVTSVYIDKDITVYAVWGYDTDESGIPDVKEEWYNLYYDANGGKDAPADETDLPVGPHTLSAQKPTHDAVDNYDVLFMGWSLTKVDSILSKDDKDKVPELVTSVYIDKDITVYAVWGYDKNGDDTPDVSQNWITITYDANGGKWDHDVTGYEMNEEKTTASIEVVSPYTLSEYLADHPAQDGIVSNIWYQDEGCTLPVPSIAVTLYQDTTLYAGYAEPQASNVSITVRKHLLNGTEDVTPKEDAAFNLIGLSVDSTTTYDALIDQYNGSPISYYGGSYVYDAARTTVNSSTSFSGTVQQGDAIDLYFVLDTSDQTTYTVEFYYGGQIDSSRTETVAAKVGSTISKYDDALTKLIEKNLDTGYKCETVTPDTLTVSAEADKNVIKVYYTKDFVAKPSLSVDKYVNTRSAKVGDTLLYYITVTNTGNVTLENIKVSDVLSRNGKALAELELYQFVNGQNIPVETIDKLEPGEAVILRAEYTVKASDAGKTLSNTAVAEVPNGPKAPGKSPDTKIDEIRDKTPALNKKDHVAYVIGYEDLTVRPENNITRAEVATIFFRLLEDSSRSYYWSQTNEFSDVSKGDWYNNAISTMANAGIITGYPDGTFRPNASITRAEFSAIAARFSDVIYNGKSSFSDVAITFWAYDEITLSEHLGWINGYPDGTFRPGKNITRAEAMTLINRVLERDVEQEHMLKDMVKWIDNDPDAWYYEAVQEATNSHTYTRLNKKVPGQSFNYEDWVKILKNPDWAALERTWSKN